MNNNFLAIVTKIQRDGKVSSDLNKKDEFLSIVKHIQKEGVAPKKNVEG